MGNRGRAVISTLVSSCLRRSNYAGRVQGMVAGAPEKQGTVEAPTHVDSVPPGIQRGG